MKDEKKQPEPRGVIAIMTTPTGDVLATASDFDLSAPGGCQLWEGQKWRAQQQVKWAAVKAYCSPALTKALGGYMLEQIADALCRDGHKITYRAIGYSDEIAAEVRH